MDMAERKRDAYERGLAQGKALQEGVSGATKGQLTYWHDHARGLAKTIGRTPEQVVENVVAYHRKRLDAVPDLAQYPELKGHRDLIDAEEQGLQDAGLSYEIVAMMTSLNFWRDVQLPQEIGRAVHTVILPEKCRVVYVPESDRGALHAKNVDDPTTYWTPRPRFGKNPEWPWKRPLVFDGVGSGLHIDELPPEIYPFDARGWAIDNCTTVEEAEEFLVRYNYFWSSQNLLVHDHEGNSIVFEKTRCRVATRDPNEKGINWITGMGAKTPEIRNFIRQQRQKYLDQVGQGPNGQDAVYWKICDGKWANMERYIGELSINPTFDNLKTLMEQRDPSGPMCLTGEKAHPDDVTPGCTLVMDIYLMDEKKLHRRQWRGDVPAFLDDPELVQFD